MVGTATTGSPLERDGLAQPDRRAAADGHAAVGAHGWRHFGRRRRDVDRARACGRRPALRTTWCRAASATLTPGSLCSGVHSTSTLLSPSPATSSAMPVQESPDPKTTRIGSPREGRGPSSRRRGGHADRCRSHDRSGRTTSNRRARTAPRRRSSAARSASVRARAKSTIRCLLDPRTPRRSRCRRCQRRTRGW